MYRLGDPEVFHGSPIVYIMDELLEEIRQCQICEEHLPFAPKPVVQASVHSKIVIIGQAPGIKVQQSGIPWDDASGKELRRWLDVTEQQFYDENIFALIPMGFCYPGKANSGDMAPRPECAPQWHHKIMEEIRPSLTLLIGQYAQKYYLKDKRKSSLTETVKNYREYLPDYLPLVHPSPRNRIWQKKNPWFEEVVQELQMIVKSVL